MAFIAEALASSRLVSRCVCMLACSSFLLVAGSIVNSPSKAQQAQKAIRHANNFNENIDKYKKTGDCDYLEYARSWAMYAQDGGSSSLANEWNDLASSCRLTPLVTGGQQRKSAPEVVVEGGPCILVGDMHRVATNHRLEKSCSDGSYLRISSP